MTFEFSVSVAKPPPSTTLGFVWMSGALLPTRVGKLRKLFALATIALFCACSGGGGGGLADNGGMSGTGISQGAVTAFGSVFVNGVEWDLTSSTIRIDGAPAIETDLRLGMIVRISGDLAPTGTTGTAIDIVFDDTVEGPIENDPVASSPDGLEMSFSTLGTLIIMNEETTAFDGGASFAGLRADDVVEVSGFVDDIGVVRATRIRLVGVFPANSNAELRGLVSDLVKNPDGSGDFSIGTILVHYVASTDFSDLTRQSLANGDFIEAKGTLRIAGNELDADEIELEIQGLGSGSIDDAEIEGFVSNFVSNGSFEVSGTLVDASAAVFDPPDFVLTNGARVEVEGRLENGVLLADSVEDEDEAEDVKIQAVVSSVDLAGQTIMVLGVTISADGETRIEDDRDENKSFGFGDIEAGDWLDVGGLQTGPSTVLALRIERDTNGDDVSLEGPVTSLDVNAPALSIIDQPIPLDSVGTSYFDDLEQSRTEEEFFRNPGLVMIGDIVQAKDESALDLQTLSEADEVAIEGD
jgi:hypothetical protein